jgi:hypothetical protein
MAARVARSGSYVEENEMALLMFHEDERRELSFDIALAHPGFQRRQANARRFRGGHIGYEMARERTRFFFCCSGCGTSLFRPQDVTQAARAVDVATIDSDTTFCVKDCNVQEDPARLVHANVMAESLKDHWSYTVQTVRCAKCKTYLGVKSWMRTEASAVTALDLTKCSDRSPNVALAGHGCRGWTPLDTRM